MVGMRKRNQDKRMKKDDQDEMSGTDVISH